MIKKIVIGIAANALALYVVTLFLTDIQYTGGVKFFLISGIVLGVLNTFVKPLMKILSFPMLIMTIGLFSIVINAIIFWLTTKVVGGINLPDVTVTVGSAWTYLIAALVFGLVNGAIHTVIRNK